MLTAANYREAIEILSKRFGNKQRIVDKHMDVLLSLEAVTSDTNLKALRRLYDKIETCDLWGSHLTLTVVFCCLWS